MGHVQTLAATLTRRAAASLAAAVCATPADRLTWQPMEQGRPILEQLLECVRVNQMWARILMERCYAPERGDGRDLDTRDKALARLETATAELVTAINGIGDEEIGRVLAIPAEDGMDLTLGEGCLYAYWNMVYHAGQISYIQTLYANTG